MSNHVEILKFCLAARRILRRSKIEIEAESFAESFTLVLRCVFEQRARRVVALHDRALHIHPVDDFVLRERNLVAKRDIAHGPWRVVDFAAKCFLRLREWVDPEVFHLCTIANSDLDGKSPRAGTRLLGECQKLPAVALVKRLLEDVSEFSLARPRLDDLTVMAIEMVGH